MKILVLNPNTSSSMTDQILQNARRHARSDIDLLPATASFGSSVIASRVSYAIANHAALDAYARYESQVHAVVLACFGDPGLEALRELSSVPVAGLLESALAEATRNGQSFAIVTAGSAWVPLLQERLQMSPHAVLSCGVFPFGTHGFDVSNQPEHFLRELQDVIDKAGQAGARSIILGGSTLAGFASSLSTRARLIDPLRAAMRDVQLRLKSFAARQHGSSCQRQTEASPLRYSGLSGPLQEKLGALGS